jgi:cell division protein ZapA
MDEDSLKRIKIIIGGRTYPIKIAVEDEASVRKIEKNINNKIKEYQIQYSTQDKQDCLAMALFTIAVELENTKTEETTSKVDDRIIQLDHILSEALR